MSTRRSFETVGTMRAVVDALDDIGAGTVDIVVGDVRIRSETGRGT